MYKGDGIKVGKDKLWDDTPSVLNFGKNRYLFDKCVIELVAL